MLIYLQPSPVRLCDRTAETEAIKQQLRESFLKRARRWHRIVTQRGYLAEPFDPRFGTPMYSPPGELLLDDVAVAHSLLKFPISDQGGCTMLSPSRLEHRSLSVNAALVSPSFSIDASGEREMSSSHA